MTNSPVRALVVLVALFVFAPQRVAFAQSIGAQVWRKDGAVVETSVAEVQGEHERTTLARFRINALVPPATKPVELFVTIMEFAQIPTIRDVRVFQRRLLVISRIEIVVADLESGQTLVTLPALEGAVASRSARLVTFSPLPPHGTISTPMQMLLDVKALKLWEVFPVVVEVDAASTRPYVDAVGKGGLPRNTGDIRGDRLVWSPDERWLLLPLVRVEEGEKAVREVERFVLVLRLDGTVPKATRRLLPASQQEKKDAEAPLSFERATFGWVDANTVVIHDTGSGEPSVTLHLLDEAAK
jgi:hypothetical protein